MMEILKDHYDKDILGIDEQIQKSCLENKELTSNEKYTEKQKGLN